MEKRKNEVRIGKGNMYRKIERDEEIHKEMKA